MMKPENAIEVNDVSKSFRVYLDKGHTLKEKTLFQRRRVYEERTVLNRISFAVKKGEAVGLIGHNGCGKSTTLKLLTKIMYPDSGTIEMRGRVSSLIELGAGFHPDMSGRENIYINASIFGLSKSEIDARLEDIVAFSELEQFIDQPVRTYSSGMYMRLAFSVAINVDADILLIDEILGVGDAGFQAKCFQWLQEIKAKGATIVIVSHSLGQMEQICDRSIWIHEGRIQMEGRPSDVHTRYLDNVGQQRQATAEKEQQRRGNPHENPSEPPEQQAPVSETKAEDSKPSGGNKTAGTEEVHVLNGTGIPLELEIEQLIQKVQNEIREEGCEWKEAAAFEETPAQNKVFIPDWQLHYEHPLKSSGTSMRRAALFLKRLIRKCSRFLIVPILDEQSGFNYSIKAEIERLNEIIRLQDQKIRELERSRKEPPK